MLVLDAGIVAEFDSPQNLLSNKHSVFFGMAKDAGLVGGHNSNSSNNNNNNNSNHESSL